MITLLQLICVMANFNRNLRSQIGSEKLWQLFNVIVRSNACRTHVTRIPSYTTRSDSLTSLLTNHIRRVHIADCLPEFMRMPCAESQLFDCRMVNRIHSFAIPLRISDRN